jgi:hypothetical protein
MLSREQQRTVLLGACTHDLFLKGGALIYTHTSVGTKAIREKLDSEDFLRVQAIVLRPQEETSPYLSPNPKMVNTSRRGFVAHFTFPLGRDKTRCLAVRFLIRRVTGIPTAIM